MRLMKASLRAILAAVLLLGAGIFPTIATANAEQDTDLPAHAAAVEQQIREKLNTNTKWTAILSWDKDRATIAYLGPEDKNPWVSKVGHSPVPRTPVSPPQAAFGSLPIGPESIAYAQDYSRYYYVDDEPQYQNAALQKGPTSYGSGSYTTMYKIEQQFTLTNMASTNSNVDLLISVNGFSSNSKHWLQGSVYYDKANYNGQGAKWYAQLDSHNTLTGSEEMNGGAGPTYYPLTTSGSSDTVVERLYFYTYDANGKSCYKTTIDDITAGTGVGIYWCTPDDTGNHLRLGRITTVGVMQAGSMMEDIAKTTSDVYKWGSKNLYLKFYQTSSSSANTQANGWNQDDKHTVSGTVSISTQNSPARVTMSLT